MKISIQPRACSVKEVVRKGKQSSSCHMWHWKQPCWMYNYTSPYILGEWGGWVYLLLYRGRYENAPIFLCMKKWIKTANLGLSSDVKHIPILGCLSGWPRFRFSILSVWMLMFLLPAWNTKCQVLVEWRCGSSSFHCVSPWAVSDQLMPFLAPRKATCWTSWVQVTSYHQSTPCGRAARAIPKLSLSLAPQGVRQSTFPLHNFQSKHKE